MRSIARCALRQNTRKQMPDMRHAGPDFELDGTTGGAQPLGHPRGIVEQNFVAADLDQAGRQSARIAKDGRGIGMSRVGSAQGNSPRNVAPAAR